MTAPRVLRWALRLAGGLLVLALAIAGGFTLYAVSTLPPLQPWHKQVLREEFSADQHAGLDFAGYQQLEARLFGELDATTAGWARDGLDPACARQSASSASRAACATDAEDGFLYSRFNASGLPNRWSRARPSTAPSG